MMIYVHTYLYDVYNQSINQSINQASKQASKQSINQSINQICDYVYTLKYMFNYVYLYIPYIIYTYITIYSYIRIDYELFALSFSGCLSTIVQPPSPPPHVSAIHPHIYSSVINLVLKCVDRKLVLSILSTCISYCVWIYLIHPEIQILAFDLSDSPWNHWVLWFEDIWECRHVQ